MTFMPVAAVLLLTMQSASPAPPPVVIEDLSQLPVQEAAAPRCGVVFAVIEGQQAGGSERAKQWPDLAKNNGREFFVRAMAKLMDDRGLNRATIAQLVAREREKLAADDYKTAYQLMEPCLLMKQSAGL